MAEMISAEEQERSLFLVQIRYLEEELERWDCFLSKNVPEDFIFALNKSLSDLVSVRNGFQLIYDANTINSHFEVRCCCYDNWTVYASWG